MIKLSMSFATLAALLIAAVTAASLPNGTWPSSTGTIQYSAPYTVKAGEVFNGKMQTFERSDITCSDGEGQNDTAVFLVEAGGTLKNTIIGKNQKEGVHCFNHDCIIENVWWDDVCEDALSIKGGSASSVTTVTNCGARYASDKIVQHDGYGTVKIKGFFAQEFGELYVSCSTCGNIPRTVTVEDVYAIDPLVSIVTVNENYGDQATLSNIYVKTTDGEDDVKVCQWSQGSEMPSNLGDGPLDTLCQYSESDIHINEQASQVAQTFPSKSSSYLDATQATSSASTGLSNLTQSNSSTLTDSSMASSSSTSSPASQTPTQAPSSSTEAVLATASSPVSSNSSTKDSGATAPGRVSPMEISDSDQSVVSTDATQAEQQDLAEEPTNAGSTEMSGLVYSSSEDVSGTDSAVSDSSTEQVDSSTTSVLASGSAANNYEDQNQEETDALSASPSIASPDSTESSTIEALTTSFTTDSSDYGHLRNGFRHSEHDGL